jgi:hypothetical protein
LREIGDREQPEKMRKSGEDKDREKMIECRE